jgi:formate dehydrogenase major subunit
VDGLLLPGRSDLAASPPQSAPIPTDDAYPLRLVATRSMYDDGVMVRACSSSRGLIRSMEIRLNPADLELIGVAPGTEVLLRSARGELEGPVHGDLGVPRGSAVIPWLAPDSPANDLIGVDSMVTDVRVERL